MLAVAAPTTGDAASIVAELGDPTVVAIASDRAARINGLTIIDGNVGDHPEAYTRFVSIAPYTRLDRRDGEWRTAFSFTTDHRPGALFHALEPLSRHGVDLNLLVSRPIPSRPFSYRFDAVLSGHPLDPEISATLGRCAGSRRSSAYSARIAPTAGAGTSGARQRSKQSGVTSGRGVLDVVGRAGTAASSPARAAWRAG